MGHKLWRFILKSTIALCEFSLESLTVGIYSKFEPSRRKLNFQSSLKYESCKVRTQTLTNSDYSSPNFDDFGNTVPVIIDD